MSKQITMQQAREYLGFLTQRFDGSFIGVYCYIGNRCYYSNLK